MIQMYLKTFLNCIYIYNKLIVKKIDLICNFFILKYVYYYIMCVTTNYNFLIKN